MSSIPSFSISAQVNLACDSLPDELTSYIQVQRTPTTLTLLFERFPDNLSPYLLLLNYLISNLKYALSSEHPIYLRGKHPTPSTIQLFTEACRQLNIPQESLSDRVQYEPRFFKTTTRTQEALCPTPRTP